MNDRAQRSMEWISRMLGAHAALAAHAPHVLAEFEAWERAYGPGTRANLPTSDWPGWMPLIGEPPWWEWANEELSSARKARIPDELRWAVWERDDFTCRSCGARRQLSVDHVAPESRGGALELDNLQTLCRSCNSRKGKR